MNKKSSPGKLMTETGTDLRAIHLPGLTPISVAKPKTLRVGRQLQAKKAGCSTLESAFRQPVPALFWLG
jgi:hypothetical protein